ncbi:hypothetical protein JSY36_09595 [Bacillus sp. H-16]|uniref:YppG family protein n=1 Tax=Alteribacter salitolerans TaxID=2912333 RepID=UPI001962A06E|nr:YppG family protein [Alteribacter salitolerans]MBM7096009.1 hypothetical protein [Alteribacter salitolerans]
MYPEEQRWLTHPRPWPQSGQTKYQGQWEQPQSYVHHPFPEPGGYSHSGWQAPQQHGWYHGSPHQGNYQGYGQQPYGGSYYPHQYGQYGYQPQSKFGGILSTFQGKDGKFDFNKAFVTVDQVMKTANQISPLMKQVGSFFTNLTP